LCKTLVAIEVAKPGHSAIPCLGDIVGANRQHSQLSDLFPLHREQAALLSLFLHSNWTWDERHNDSREPPAGFDLK
jgi:hypothetical protein